MLEDCVIANREYRGATWDCRSYVGIAYPSEGQIVTGLLNHDDPKLAVQVSKFKTDDYEVLSSHVFVGLYLDRILKAQPMQFEVFRLHRDVFKHGHPEEVEESYGELLISVNFKLGRMSLALERFRGMPELANTDLLIEHILTDNLDALFLPCPAKLAPDAGLYRPSVQPLPHPGVAFEGLEHEAELADMFRKSPVKVTYVN